ncbi:FxsA family protein [Pseudooceanicola aestuarii]|uniref:FxsA family protein n=1 Tax=Pseudooceanicola aestuarii TaxID=2697319 RepID=UPI0013D3CFC1|nr:FxsA family protein [Pseudooceanicola aestuarii]
MWLLFAFIAIPMIEIALFIQVGGVIGLGWTLAIVLVTAILGTWLVRAQGALAMNRIRQSFGTLNDPSEPLADGAMILLAGALLLTPGFFTDVVGFALLTPAFRKVAFHWLRKRIRVQGFSAGPTARGPYRDARPTRPDILEGEYTEVDPPKTATHRPSGWTKH